MKRPKFKPYTGAELDALRAIMAWPRPCARRHYREPKGCSLFRRSFKSVHYALPDYFTYALGTAVIWGEAGASGVTATLSFDALASGSARMGAAVDLGAAWDQEQVCQAKIESGTAPTAGLPIDVYLAWSYDNSLWPGGVTGSDGAWPADGNEDEWAQQLGPPSLSVMSTNDTNTVQVQQPVSVLPVARYVATVVDNNWDQAIRDEATATNNDSRVYLIPRRSLVQDS